MVDNHLGHCKPYRTQVGLTRVLCPPRYVRTIFLPGKAPPVRLVMAPSDGFLLAHSWADLGLHLFTVNGRLLTSAEGTERLNALVIPPDGKLLLTGGAKGLVTLRWLHSLQVPSPAPFHASAGVPGHHDPVPGQGVEAESGCPSSSFPSHAFARVPGYP